MGLFAVMLYEKTTTCRKHRKIRKKKDENGIVGSPSEKKHEMELFAVMLYGNEKNARDHSAYYNGVLIQGRYYYYLNLVKFAKKWRAGGSKK